MRRLIPLLCSVPVLTSAATLQTGGFLLDSVDRPVDSAALPVRFRLLDAPLAGNVLWESSPGCSVPVRAGHYAALLGSTCGPAIPDAALPTDQPRFLEVAIDGVVLSPLQALTPVPGALRSADTQALLTRLSSSGTVNASGNPVSWTQLKDVPASIVDGDADTLYAAGAGLVLSGTTFEVGSGAVATAMLAPGSVTASKLAPDVAAALTPADGSISTVKIADAGVTATKLADGSVNTSKLADGSVTLAKLSSDVTSSLTVADGAITSAKLGADAASLSKVSGGLLSVSGSMLSVGGSVKLGNDTAACVAARAGSLRWNGTALQLCDGSSWQGLSLSLPRSCQDVYNAGSRSNGEFSIDPDGAGGTNPFIVSCNNAEEGGGWTRVIRINPSNFANIYDQPNSVEYINNGTFTFSKTLLKNSNREVFIREVGGANRMHRYDFKQGSNLQGEDFVGAITGDVNASYATWDWVSGGWSITNPGGCNGNNHSQWNCVPSNGVRFHYGTRDWTGNGGSAVAGAWFTGYSSGYGDLGRLVKNWNGAYDSTAHDLYVR